MLSNVLDSKGEGVGSPSHGGAFLDFGVIKPAFWWVIKLKLTSILAPNVYYDCSIRGEGTVSVVK